MPLDAQQRRLVSLVALVLTNVGVLIAVVFEKIAVQDVLLLYWSESAVIGFFTVLKILTAADGRAEREIEARRRETGSDWELVLDVARRVFMSAFFCVHFGGFMFVHFLFLGMLLPNEGAPSIVDPRSATILSGLRPVLLGIVGLFLSHGVSFFAHWLFGGERRTALVAHVFTAPYARIFVMHITILLGAAVVFQLRSAIFPVAVLIVLKTAIDGVAHWREHREPRADSAAGSADG